MDTEHLKQNLIQQRKPVTFNNMKNVFLKH
jgi:hypothetical protein